VSVKYLPLWALVSSVVGCGPQVQRLAARRSDAFPRGGGGGFCRLCDLNALRRHSFLLIFELEDLLPAVSRCSVLLVVAVATRHKEEAAVCCFATVIRLWVCLCHG